MARALQAGDEAPVKELTLTRTDLVIYAGASGDFNPMHHDEVLAQQAGLPSVFGHGMFSMGFLGGAVTDFVGLEKVQSYSVRFVRQTWPGEVLRTKVVVREVADGVVTLDCSLENSDGEVKVTGQATAAVA
jgi:acyl dehydratase